jgi:UDP-N-acetylglucosamine acyltransferase
MSNVRELQMAEIDSKAVVHPEARIGEGVRIGPFCVVGPEVTLGRGTELKSHVVVDGRTDIGEDCVVWPFASIGTQSQDLKYDGGSPGVRIGNRTTLREYATVNAATADGDLTVVGDDCHIMAYSHVAHDCVVGNGVIMANAATLAGHVVVEDQAILGGLTGVHQFVTVGKLSITGGCSKVVQDIPPFMTADGNPLKIRGVNKIGLERHGFPPETIKALRDLYKLVYREKLGVKDMVEASLASIPRLPAVEYLESFIQKSERGVTR